MLLRWGHPYVSCVLVFNNTQNESKKTNLQMEQFRWPFTFLGQLNNLHWKSTLSSLFGIMGVPN